MTLKEYKPDTTITGRRGDDTPEDKKATQSVLNQIDVYPLWKVDGKLKSKDWFDLKHFPDDTGSEELKWVKAELFFNQLSAVLDEVPPLAGDEAIYAQICGVLAGAQKDANLKDILK